MKTFFLYAIKSNFFHLIRLHWKVYDLAFLWICFKKLYSYFLLNHRKRITTPSITITIIRPKTNGSIGNVDCWGVCVGLGEIMGDVVGVGVIVGDGDVVGLRVGVGLDVVGFRT